jgi:fructose-bisphosphate aldolase, class I
MDRDIDGLGSAEYLWSKKGVVPFLKVDKGLAEEADGVQVMKPIPGLDALLERAVEAGVFGTKMRSVISRADKAGVEAVVDQQFQIARQIVGHGLVPIIEPEVDIYSETKAEAEELLRASIIEHLDQLAPDEQVMLKLSIPSVDDFYRPLIEHPNVVRVVALSGGYPRDEANQRLARNHGMIASFSRALTEGLTAQMSDVDFDEALAKTIDAIFAASST